MEFARVSVSLFNISICSLCVQIAATSVSSSLPPTLFIHMPKDQHIARHVQKAVQTLQRRGIPASQLSCMPISLIKEPAFFFTHGNALSKKESEVFINALKKANYLSLDGFLLEDPRLSRWREVAQEVLSSEVRGKDSLRADESAIAEVMNVAWAEHEITDEHIDETLTWFQSHSTC